MIQLKQETEFTSFDNAWWDRFMQETSNLSHAAVFKNSISPGKVAFYEEGILEILRELARLRTNQYGYRVFIDGVQLEKLDMDVIYDAPPELGESFTDWSARVFGDKKFGMIINVGEKFNQALSRDIALVMAPLFERIKYPQEGINFTLFIGNYDKTPLGIHQDKRGESVMHFHLGPGTKTMYLWEPNNYEKLLSEGTYKRSEIDKLRPLSTAYHFGKGDIFFMPEGIYHIGEQEGFSVGLTVWRYNHSDDRLYRGIHDMVYKNFLGERSSEMRGDNNELDDTSAIDPILKSLRISSDLKNLSYEDLMRETYRDWRYSLHSNAGFRGVPTPHEQREQFKLDDELEISAPYKILIKFFGKNEKMYLFVRGHKLEFNYFQCIVDLVEQLNTGKRYSVRQLLGFLDPSWDEKIGLYFLGEIHRCHGLNKIASQPSIAKDKHADLNLEPA